MKKKNWIKVVTNALLLVTVIGTGPLFAGGQADGSGSNVVTYWCHNNSDFVAANQALIDKFEAANPDIRVEMEAFPYDVLVQKMQAAYVAGNESDIQQIFGSWAIQYTRNGLFAEIPAAITGDVSQRFYPAQIGGYMYQGKVYGIPREFNIENGGVLYYPALLAEAGFDRLPNTWAELVEVARALTTYDTEGNITRAGFDFVSWDNITFTLLALILQQGGTYWAEDGIHVSFATPEAQTAAGALADMLVADKVTDFMHNGPDDSADSFFKEKSAICIKGPWSVSMGINSYGRDDFMYGPMPSWDGGEHAFAAESGWGEVVSARSADKEHVWRFYEFMTSTESNRLWNEMTSTVPSEPAIAEAADYLDANPYLKVSTKVMPYAQPIGPLFDTDAFKWFINSNFEKVALGEISVADALKAIETDTNAMIDEQRAQ